MDSLDLNTHTDILLSLAESYALSKTDNEPVQILNKLPPKQVLSKGKIKQDAEPSSMADQEDGLRLTNLQAYHVIAYAAYISHSVVNQVPIHSKSITRICDLLKDLTSWSIEFNLRSAENIEEWPLADEIAYRLMTAGLQAGSSVSEGDRSILVETFVTLMDQVTEKIVNGHPSRIVSHHLPVLSGMGRALSQSHFPFTPEAFAQLFPSLTDSPLVSPSSQQLEKNISIFKSASDPYLSDYRDIERLKARYDLVGSPLTPQMITHSVLQQCRHVLERCLISSDLLMSSEEGSRDRLNDSSWNQLMLMPIKEKGIGSNVSAIQDVNSRSMSLFSEFCASYQKTLVAEDLEEYVVETICETIKLSTVSALALGLVSDEVFEQLLLLHSEEAALSHPHVQVSATESLVILAQNFPHLVNRITEAIRTYIISPLPPPDLAPPIVNDRPRKSVLSAAMALAQCVKLNPSKESSKALMYALMNHINTSEVNITTPNGSGLANSGLDSRKSYGNTFSPAIQQLVSINALHALVILLDQEDQAELNSTMVPILLLRLKGASFELEAAILISISHLALNINKQCFQDVISALAFINKNIGLEPSENTSPEAFFQSGLHRAQCELARGLIDKPELIELYLTEFLTLFIDKGKSIQTSFSALPSQQFLINHLGVLIPTISNLLHSNSPYNPRQTSSVKLSELFRNFWYFCVLFDFLLFPKKTQVNQGGHISSQEWLLPALRQIAARSPTLTHLTPTDYLTTQLDYNPILKFSDASLSATPSKVNRSSSTNLANSYQATVEQAKKQELANLIPTHSGHIRALNFVQTMFLLTTARLETFRAEVFRVSNILEYLSHASPSDIDANNLFGCLVTISERVLDTFVSSFQQRAVRHKEVTHIHEEILEVLKSTCHFSSRIRSVALRYCQDIITSFPSLLCNFETICAMLELLTLLRVSCEGEYEDEYSPRYTFHSERANLTIDLVDDYYVRHQILDDLHKAVRRWLSLAISRSTLEMRNIFLKYLDGTLTPNTVSSVGNIEMGKSIALEMAKMIPTHSQLSTLPIWGNWTADLSNDLARSFSNRMFYNGQAMYLSSLPEVEYRATLKQIKEELSSMSRSLKQGGKRPSPSFLTTVLYKAGSHVVASSKPDPEILSRIISIPIRSFTPFSCSLGLELWTWLIDAKPEVEIKLVTEVLNMWDWTLRRRKGLFSNAHDLDYPLNQSIQFTSTDRAEMQHHHNTIKRMLKPHSVLIDFISSRFQAARYKSRSIVLATMRLLKNSFESVHLWTLHPLSRELRARLIIFGFSICQGSRMEDSVEHLLRGQCYSAAFNWFCQPLSFGFASSRLQHESELRLLQELLEMVKVDQLVNAYRLSSLDSKSNQPMVNDHAVVAALGHSQRKHLLELFLEHEIICLTVWHNPLSDPKKRKDLEASVAKSTGEAKWRETVRAAWAIKPELAFRLSERFKNGFIEQEISFLVKEFPRQARSISEALPYFVGSSTGPCHFDLAIIPSLHHILYWKKAPVVTALTYFLPQYDSDPILLQYAMRVLEEHPVDVTFFYIPQVVQALRTDKLGYVERFICETAQVSQLFCHQIIWNMKANTLKGDETAEPDSMKPTLERIISLIVNSLSGESKKFYEVEFKFFDEVTGISKTLKQYLKKDKSEKKAKITEELSKIKLVEGVYLPSNPDGTVVDIDRNSGRPLQSHAKTPFLASFKVHREKMIHLEDETDENGEVTDIKRGVDIWQAAIFKVGDDCRQDLLALQIIAIHKTIYESMCLDLHLVPYRVTATAPGCGVIDVIPDATSRDEMGRAKINDLNSFFIGKFGPTDSIAYQNARMNFIRSMAAYSVMCYLIQIKDRHNGNIMIDGEGHITHVDFGFLFDIGPGGIKFEPNSFKLTGEMIVLMGGQHSAGFRYFQELVIKAFLIARPFSKEIVTCVKLMSETQLPSFKGEGTINRLLDRFKPNLTEREAAVYMQGVINNAKQNGFSLLYDEFQWMTNEIPYTQRDWISRAS
ncbi:hypothetical protein PPACK8108_LOCUS3895 [Phakopsora pachyrhizi]|uniref:1-phosphatidylinositol 4-kinase n=1 Tax=Phakopsora pachyrhizi TaxID=170000 RepID=A0AAV0AN34_PHAPC|nr:hypothetical protein PPACK8108_LOCUS3895 [Phakopsora pachyrhizi]